MVPARCSFAGRSVSVYHVVGVEHFAQQLGDGTLGLHGRVALAEVHRHLQWALAVHQPGGDGQDALLHVGGRRQAAQLLKGHRGVLRGEGRGGKTNTCEEAEEEWLLIWAKRLKSNSFLRRRRFRWWQNPDSVPVGGGERSAAFVLATVETLCFSHNVTQQPGHWEGKLLAVRQKIAVDQMTHPPISFLFKFVLTSHTSQYLCLNPYCKYRSRFLVPWASL